MPLSFEEDLACLLEQARADGTPFDELRGYVEDLFRKHNREVPPSITGTVATIEPEDRFGD
jgi:hypothetical protein